MRLLTTILLTCWLLTCCTPLYAAILVQSSNGTYTAVSTLSAAATMPAAAGHTVVVTSALSAVQSNISSATVHAWPSDRDLQFEKGGSIGNTTTFRYNGSMSRWPSAQVFSGTGVVALPYARPQWFGGDNTGVADSTIPWNRAIMASPNVRGVGTWLVTSELTISPSVRQSLDIGGDETGKCRFIFNPSSTSVLLHVVGGGYTVYPGRIHDIVFNSTNSVKKTAIKLDDCSDFTLQRLTTNSLLTGTDYSWTGGGSVGIQTCGRQLITFDHINIATEYPVWISRNTNTSDIHIADCDLFHFIDCNLIAASAPGISSHHYVILVDNNVNIFNMCFSGYNCWNMGCGGFYYHNTWTDPGSTGRISSAYNWDFSGVRYEQGDTNALMLDISSTNYIENIKVDNIIIPDSTVGGFRFRKCNGVSLRNVVINGATGTTALDADDIIHALIMENFQYVVTATFSTGALRQRFATPYDDPTYAGFAHAIYDLAGNGLQGWQIPTLTNSWVNVTLGNQPARYWKDSTGVVHLGGYVKSGTMGQSIFTLPAGYIPASAVNFGTISNGAFGGGYITGAGLVIPTAGSNAGFSLDGVSFRTD